MFEKTAQIVKPIWMADKSVRLLIEYGELTPNEVAEIIRLFNEGLIRTILASEKDLEAIANEK